MSRVERDSPNTDQATAEVLTDRPAVHFFLGKTVREDLIRVIPIEVELGPDGMVGLPLADLGRLAASAEDDDLLWIKLHGLNGAEALEDGQDKKRISLLNGEIVIDFEARELNIAGEAVHLTTKEFDVLWYLASKRGRAVSHEELIHQCWGMWFSGRNHAVTIAHLRKKLNEHKGLLKTVRGIGYKVVDPLNTPIKSGLDSKSFPSQPSEAPTSFIEELVVALREDRQHGGALELPLEDDRSFKLPEHFEAEVVTLLNVAGISLHLSQIAKRIFGRETSYEDKAEIRAALQALHEKQIIVDQGNDYYATYGPMREVDVSENQQKEFQLPEGFAQQVIAMCQERIHIGQIIVNIFGSTIPYEQYQVVRGALSDLYQNGMLNSLGRGYFITVGNSTEQDAPTEELPQPTQSLDKMLRNAGIHRRAGSYKPTQRGRRRR